jgi:thiol-disulfide isomerase/thioredoxin
MRPWGIGIVALLAVTHLQAAALNSPAPKFALINSHKERKTLSSFKGKVVFINFWASWCAPCQMELPELKRLADEYPRKRFQILAINVDTDRKAARRLISKLGLATSHLEILWDSRSKAVSAFNIETMPSSFILDSRGVIRFAHSGFHQQDPETWRKEVNQLIP